MSTHPDATTALAVIVPVRDRLDLLKFAVESVLRQAPQNVQVIVVDDGSVAPVENTMFMDERVRISRTMGVGAAMARNVGIECAKDAAWVTFLDSDDEAMPGWIAAILDAQQSGATLFSCGAEYRWAHGEIGVARVQPLWRGDDAPRGLFLAGTFATQRELMLEAGGYRPGLRHGENTDLGWRLGGVVRRKGSVVASTDEPLVAINAVRKNVSPVVLLESAQLVLADPPDLLAENCKEMADLLAVAGVAASRLGRRLTASRYLVRSARRQPLRPKAWGRVIKAATWGWSELTP